MSKCPNCGSKITCGCQRRTTSDGRSACTNCVNKPVKTTKETETVTPKKTVTGNKLNLWGKERYKNLNKFTT